MVPDRVCARCGAIRHTPEGVCPACGYDEIATAAEPLGRPVIPTGSPSRCPQCGAAHGWAEPLCRECGRRVYSVCPDCRTANAVGHRFCVYCGAGIRVGATFSIPAIPHPSRLRRFSLATGRFSRWRTAWLSARDAVDISRVDWFTLPSRRAQLLVEIGLVSLLTLLALLIRVWNMGTVPPGPAGDESAVALETIRILGGQWIGIWSGVALGNPTGHMFWVAPFFWMGGPTLAMLRLSSALPGVALIPVCYLMARMLFPLPVALIAAAFVVFFSWFIIIYRIGIPITLSVFLAASTIALVVYSVRSSRIWMSLAAGIVMGAGLYVFKGYVIYFVAIWGATLLVLLVNSRLRRIWSLYAFLGASAITGAVMLEFYAGSGYLTSNLESQYHVSQADLWSFPSHLGRMLEILLYVNIAPAFGEFGFDGIVPTALLHPALSVFFWIGLLVAAMFINRPPFQLLLLGWLIAMAPAILVPGGETRRYLLGVFFVFVIAAVGFTALIPLMLNRGLRWLNHSDCRRSKFPKTWMAYSLATLASIALISVFAVQNLSDVNRWSQARETRFQFDPEIARAAEYLATVDESYAVRFYSVRWAADYETVRWFAPLVEGVNGSREFGGDGTIFSNGVVETPTVFMLLGGYQHLIKPLQETYPGGGEYTETDQDGKPLFVAYKIDDPPLPGSVQAPPYYRLNPNPEEFDLRVGVPVQLEIETNHTPSVRTVLNPLNSGSANLAYADLGCPGQTEATRSLAANDPFSIVACQAGATEIILYSEPDGSVVKKYLLWVAENQQQDGNTARNESVTIVPEPATLEIRASAFEHHPLHLIASRSLLIIPSPGDSVIIHNNPDLLGKDGCTGVEKRPEGDSRLSLIWPDDGIERRSLFYVVGCAPGAAALDVVSNNTVVATYTFTIENP